MAVHRLLATTPRPGSVAVGARRPGNAGRAGAVLALQAGAGNRAVSRLVAPTIQRCGPTPCDCSDEERAEHAATHGTAAPPVQRAASDFAIAGKFSGAAGDKSTLFFDVKTTAPDADELAKVPALATPVSQPLTLKGSASEEGTAGSNTSLVNSRIAAVDSALAGAGHTGPRTPDPKPGAGSGSIDYRQARSVEIVAAGHPSTHPDCSLGSQENDCGTAPSAFTTALKHAHEMISKSITALSAPDAATNDLLTRLFGSPGVAPTLVANFTLINGQLTNMEPFGGSVGHRCVNACDADCGGGATAFNNGTGKGALMTLCPVYMSDPDLNSRASVLIHEGSHGTEGLETQDLSYQWQKLITQLPAASSIKNADSYTALALLLDKPGSITLGPDAPDSHDVHMTKDQTDAGDQAVAWIQQWLMGMSSEVSSLYGIVNGSRATTPRAWTNTYYQGTMKFIAPVFGLHSPPPVPPLSDQIAIAGINDRYQLMLNRVGQQIAIRTSPSPTTTFGPGATLTLGTTFFGQTPRKRVETLLTAVIAAEPSIRASLRGAYRRALLRILTRNNIGSP